MKKYIFVGVILSFLPFFSACAEKIDDEALRVNGLRFDYLIPKKYQNSSSSILYAESFSGDDGDIISLLLNQQTVPDSLLGDNWELSVLLFWDSHYPAAEDFYAFANNMLGKARFEADTDGYYKYLNTLGEDLTQYYLNFDRSQSNYSKQGDEYFVIVESSPAFEIEGIKKTPADICQLHSQYDGIGIQLSTVGGQLCRVEKFDLLHSFIVDHMRKWATDK